MRLFVVILSMYLAPVAAAKPPAEQVIHQHILDGEQCEPMRGFGVPVICNDEPADFVMACNGPTRISASLAKQCHADVMPDEQLSHQTDAQGKPIFAGVAKIRLRLAERESQVTATVVNDAYCQKTEKQGVLGFDLVKDQQWEVDPSAATLTLRPAGEPPQTKPLAIVPLKEHDGAYFVKVKARNVMAEVALVPASSFIQAGPDLQRAWDLNSKKRLDINVKTFGDVRVLRLGGRDAIELAPDLRETDLPVALIGKDDHGPQTNAASSGLGQCLLNRFVYCVEPRRQQLRLLRRAGAVGASKGGDGRRVG